MERLKSALEELRRATDLRSRASQDPVSFPRRFGDPRDVEVAAWLSSALAYGQVPAFKAALERLFAVMGESPAAYARAFRPERDLGAFEPLYYRMNRGLDLAALIWLIGRVLERRGSVEGAFLAHYRASDPDTGRALDGFVREALSADTAPVYGRDIRPYGLTQLLSPPSLGSACKRLNLYLRWMVRPDDGVDFGLWKGVPPSKLVIPLDTHILRIGRYLGLTRRRSAGWKAALDITRALKRLDPEDPLKYDFPLCHHGISGACPVGRSPGKCRACPLLGVCAKGRMLTR